MKSKKYTEFKDKYLSTFDDMFLNQMGDILKKQNEIIKNTMKNQLEQLIHHVVLIQNEVPIKIGCIQISLLLSSLQTQNPELMYEVYDEGKEFGTLLYAQTFQCNWLLPHWQEEMQQLKSKIAELKWQSYLGEGAVHALMWEKIDAVIQVFAISLKYDFDNFRTFKEADRLLKSDEFYLSIGEYRGWQKIVYCDKQEKDIFQERINKNFSYMRFPQRIYKDKLFGAFQLKSTRFDDCVFVDTVFNKANLQDAEFHNCVFRNCRFEECILNGCIFENCDLQRLEWKENQLKKGPVCVDNRVVDVCRPTMFIRCIIHNNYFQKNVLFECLKIECDEKDNVEENNEVL